MRIKFIRSKDSFCLMGDNPRIIKVVSAMLLVRRVRLSPSVAVAHAKALEIGSAKYPIKRMVCKSTTIPTGLLDANQEKLFSGQIPTRLVIGLVDNEAFNGSYNRNPFNFAHFNLSEISVYIDGQQGDRIRPLKLNFANDQFIEGYITLFTGTGKINRNEGNSIKPSEYNGGYALYAFDLTPDLSKGDHFNLIKQGDVRLSLKFAEALPRAVTVIAYAEFENVIEIDRARNILFNFSK
jgi:hypothetical protein